MTPSKQKGTGAERELVKKLEALGYEVRRTSPGHSFDIWADHTEPVSSAVQVLATRPDRGQWLGIVDLDVLLDLIEGEHRDIQIESKRYRKFAHHTIFEETFPR